MSMANKASSPEQQHRLDREGSLWKALRFQSAGQENYLLCVYPKEENMMRISRLDRFWCSNLRQIYDLYASWHEQFSWQTTDNIFRTTASHSFYVVCTY